MGKSTFQILMDRIGLSQSISNLISNTQSGIDSITEVYDVLYNMNLDNTIKVNNLETQIVGLSSSYNGTSGTSGIDGSNGTSGTSGIDGSNGSSGINGIDGSNGSSGINGIDGSNGSSGTNGASGINGTLNDSTIGGYLLASNTQRPYKLTVGQVQSTSVTGTINGESIYGHKFYCQPGSVIDDIAFRIMTAGASGLGLAACRILIYRSKLNASGNIVAGNLELDTNINISTLSPGLKVVSGLNHTLSSNTYKDCWFICIRNYQSGSLSLKLHSNTGTVTWYADLSQSSTTYARDMGWYFLCPHASATPASMPATSSSTATATTVAAYGDYIMFGYSAT
jgi:hypothetical protein